LARKPTHRQNNAKSKSEKCRVKFGYSFHTFVRHHKARFVPPND
jgi:hypothetical protein